MHDPTKSISDAVRIMMSSFAGHLNRLTKGKLLPAHITVTSFLGHLPAAWALYSGRPLLAAGLITVFGLMDSLDGALAREQNSASRVGMYFDAVTDRLKEVILYSALIVYTTSYMPSVYPWAVVAVAGTSLLVSYVKAKGEMAFAGLDIDVQKLNRKFDDGLARYEIRMVLLVIGLATGILAPLLHFIIALNLITAATRFSVVSQELINAESAQIKAETTPKKTDKKHKDA